MSLTSDCPSCMGLCCAALPFTRGAGFGFDKQAGEPCRHLTEGFACGIHDRLRSTGFPGCTVYECFGAGQQVTQVTYAGDDWRSRPDLAQQMFAVFRVVRRLHEMLALLDLAAAVSDRPAVGASRARVAEVADGRPEAILDADVDRLQASVGDLLATVSAEARGDTGERLAGADLVGRDLRGRDLRDADLRGALLIAADLRHLSLDRTDLLGADLRDADVRGADLRAALFLTQPQVNAARGDAGTRLPDGLARPGHW